MSSEHPAAVVVLEPGVVLDRYELLSIIARGGMANVWLARFKGKHGFEKLVAIKTILPEHAADKRFQRMFLDEARIASRVEHVNVAQILDLGEWYDTLYLVMEYVDGDSLSRLRRALDRKDLKIPVPITLRILSDICGGLHAAHELKGPNGLLGVVHRDISPQNVLINDMGTAKLIDFGVAKARDRLEETSSGFAKGKSRYMSPEQAIGTEVDRRADIYAIGAVAYEIFTGHAPYDGPNDMARLHALISGLDITSVPGSPHPGVEKILVKALARDPAKRYATAAELRTAFEDVMVQLKVRASTDDVAAFVEKHMSSRAAERKRLVQLAIDAAAERQRLKEILDQGPIAGRPPSSSQVDADSSSSLEPPRSAPVLPAPEKPSEASTSGFMPASASVSPPTGGDRARRNGLVWLGAGIASGLILALAFVVINWRSSTSAASVPPPAPPPIETTTASATAPPAIASTASIAPPPPPAPSVTSSATATVASTVKPVRPAVTATVKPRPTATGKKNVVIQ